MSAWRPSYFDAVTLQFVANSGRRPAFRGTIDGLATLTSPD